MISHPCPLQTAANSPIILLRNWWACCTAPLWNAAYLLQCCCRIVCKHLFKVNIFITAFFPSFHYHQSHSSVFSLSATFVFPPILIWVCFLCSHIVPGTELPLYLQNHIPGILQVLSWIIRFHNPSDSCPTFAHHGNRKLKVHYATFLWAVNKKELCKK